MPASQPTTAAEPGFETDFTDKPEPAAEPSGKSNSSSPEAHAALAQPAMQTPSPPAASTQLSLPEQEALEREPPIDTEALLSQYVKTVKARILGHKYYPRTAERLGHRGEVVVRFALDASGDLRGLSVESSSGWAELDAASLAAVQNAAPFAALPTALGREELPLVITLKYQLD